MIHLILTLKGVLGMVTLRHSVASCLVFAAITALPGAARGFFQGSPDEGTLWPKSSVKKVVPILACFRPPNTVSKDRDGNDYKVNYANVEWLQKHQLVRDALEDSWQGWTEVVFEGWGTCPNDLSGYL